MKVKRKQNKKDCGKKEKEQGLKNKNRFAGITLCYEADINPESKNP